MADLKGTVGMSDTKLLPCPFCGSEASMFEAAGYFYAGCISGDCITHPESDLIETRENAVAAWDTRTPSVNQRLLDALKGVLEATPQEECDADCTEDNCPWKEAKIAIAEAEAQQ